MKRGSLGILFVVLAIAGAFVLTDTTSASREEPREIVLVAEDMAFYLLGGGGTGEASRMANPTLELERGERIRLTLVNRDSGFEHDWAAGTLDAATGVVPGDGSVTSTLFEAPQEPGRHEYVCSLHDRMMRGVIEVR